QPKGTSIWSAPRVTSKSTNWYASPQLRRDSMDQGIHMLRVYARAARRPSVIECMQTQPSLVNSILPWLSPTMEEAMEDFAQLMLGCLKSKAAEDKEAWNWSRKTSD